MTSNIFAERRHNFKTVTSGVRRHFSIIQNSPIIKITGLETYQEHLNKQVLLKQIM
jgi:hypothetical protein